MSNNVLLGASWCGPCKRVKEYLDGRGVNYDYVDVDTEVGMKIAQDWMVRTVPSMSIGGTIVSGDAKIMEAFGE